MGSPPDGSKPDSTNNARLQQYKKGCFFWRFGDKVGYIRTAGRLKATIESWRETENFYASRSRRRKPEHRRPPRSSGLTRDRRRRDWHPRNHPARALFRHRSENAAAG